LAISPSGRYFAAGAEDGQVLVWSATDLRQIHQFAGQRDRVAHLAFSWNEQSLASAEVSSVRIWDVRSGNETGHLQDQLQECSWLGFTPDDTRLLASEQGRYGAARYLNPITAKPIIGIESLRRLAGFLPDKTLLANVDNSTDRLIAWDTATESFRFLKRQIRGGPVAVSADASRVATLIPLGFVDGVETMDRRIHVWDIATGRELAVEDGRSPYATFSPDGTVFLVAPQQGPIRRLEFPK
jgi:WD40 repeat protein